MKINFPRHILYLTLFSVLMVIFSIWFATGKLIPMGREYKKSRLMLKKERLDLRRYKDFHEETLHTYNQTKTKNRLIIKAFDNKFNPENFKSKFSKYFINLSIHEASKKASKEWYDTYEVNTTSKITSPTSFYSFLDALNKSEWIVGVSFPINFSKDGELIHSSFTMEVYKKTKEVIQKKEEK